MKTIVMKSLALFMLLLLTTIACKKEEIKKIEEPMLLQDADFRKVINTGGGFADPIESFDATAPTITMEVINGENWECSTKTVSIQDGAGGNAGYPLFSPNADVIYPGSMLQGKSLASGTPDPIVVERAGGVISTDIFDGNSESTFEVESVSKSSVTQAINNIIAGGSGTIPAEFFINIKNIQSREQFALELGVDVNSTFVDLESKLEYSSDNSKSTFMVNLTQKYYTMSFDLPTSLNKLFAPSVRPEDLALYVGPDNPATYISSVTYGRIFYMLIESTSSQQEVEAKVKLAFNGVTTDVEGEVKVNYLKELDNVTYSAFAYGGDAGGTFKAVGETNMDDLLEILKESTDIGAGKPLSYVVRSVYDNKIVSTQLATDYTVKECEPANATNTLPAIAHWTGQVIDKIGSVAAAYANGEDKFILMNEQGQWLRSSISNTGEALLEGPFEWQTPFNGVGATYKVLGQQDSDLYVFDPSGTKYAIYATDGTWSEVKSISEYYLGQCPFNVVGIGAIAYGKYKNIDLNNPFANTGFNQYHFNSAGDKYSRAYLASFSLDYFGSVYELYQFGADHSVSDKIDGVGAAIGFTVGGQNGKHFFILFNKAGTEYIVQGNINGNNASEVIGPFDL